VFFVGTSRVTATIGDGTTTFAGTTPWSAPFDAARAALPVAPPPGAWLTVFQDDAAPRPGTDELWFDKAKDPSPVKPPPVLIDVRDPIYVPLDLLGGAAVIGLLVRTALRRRKRPAG
jgi:hypothetical protein